MLKVGDKAPSLQLESSDGRKVTLKDFAGKHLVVYFYPRDSTPGCTVEAQGFRDVAKELAKRNAVVVGVSKDSIASHCKFRDKYELNFPLLSDPEGKTIEAWGAWGEKVLYGKRSMGIIRSTVIVDGAGRVAAVFPKVKVAGHVAEVLKALDGK